MGVELTPSTSYFEKASADFLEAYKKAKIMRPTKLIGSETLEGKSTWHYAATLDKQELKSYLNEITKIIDSKESDKKQMDSLIDKIEFKKFSILISDIPMNNFICHFDKCALLI